MRGTMKNVLSTTAALALAALLSTPASAQVDLSRFVQLGDSISAGYLDACWVEHGQRDVFGAILARQAGVDFQQPLLKEPGVGSAGVGAGKGCLVLAHLVPSPSFSRKDSVVTPLNLNLPRPYNNLSVPGFKVQDVTDVKTAAENGNPLTDVVLRKLGATALQQAASLKPTFVTVFIGANDYITGPIGTGAAIEGVTLTPLNTILPKFRQILDTLKAAQGGTGKGIVMTVPDVALLPFVSAIPATLLGPDGQPVVDPSKDPAISYPYFTYLSQRHQKSDGFPLPIDPGPTAQIPPTSLITLNASAFIATGFGVPCKFLDAIHSPAADPRRKNCDKPMPDDFDSVTGVPGVVLYPDEVQAIRNRVDAFNALIVSTAPAAGFKIFDLAAVLNDFGTSGRSIAGVGFTTSFLSGGLFSLDGVHQTTIGSAFLARELIAFINREYGATIPDIDMYPFVTTGSGSGAAQITPPLSTDELMAKAAEIYSPENWESLRYMFGIGFVPELEVGDGELHEHGGRAGEPTPKGQ